MDVADFIGGRGEAIAYTHLARMCRDNDLPYFVPHHLGEKCPTFDFLIELVDEGEVTAFFFVQVKATRKEYTKTQKPPRLRVEVSVAHVRRMATYPAPTYIVGVQEKEERAFVIAVFGTMREAIPSITTGHELTVETLQRLWDEVRTFWHSRTMTQETSFFTN